MAPSKILRQWLGVGVVLWYLVRFLRHYWKIRPSRSARKAFIYPREDAGTLSGEQNLTQWQTLYRTCTDLFLKDSLQWAQYTFGAFMYVVFPILKENSVYSKFACHVMCRYPHLALETLKIVAFRSDKIVRNVGYSRKHPSRCRLDIYCPSDMKNQTGASENQRKRPVLILVHGTSRIHRSRWSWNFRLMEFLTEITLDLVVQEGHGLGDINGNTLPSQRTSQPLMPLLSQLIIVCTLLEIAKTWWKISPMPSNGPGKTSTFSVEIRTESILLVIQPERTSVP